MEFQRNKNEYVSFLVSRSPYEEVQKYLNEKSYSHEIGNIIINPLNAVLPSYRNQSTDLHSKSIDWFLYEGNTGI